MTSSSRQNFRNIFRPSRATILVCCVFALGAIVTVPYVQSHRLTAEGNTPKTRTYMRGIAHATHPMPSDEQNPVSVGYDHVHSQNDNTSKTLYIIPYNPFNQTESDWPASRPRLYNTSSAFPLPYQNTSTSTSTDDNGDDPPSSRDVPRTNRMLRGRLPCHLHTIQREPTARPYPSERPHLEVATK